MCQVLRNSLEIAMNLTKPLCPLETCSENSCGSAASIWLGRGITLTAQSVLGARGELVKFSRKKWTLQEKLGSPEQTGVGCTSGGQGGSVEEIQLCRSGINDFRTLFLL